MSKDNPSILWSVDQPLTAAAKMTAQNNMGVGNTMVPSAMTDPYIARITRDSAGNIQVIQKSIQSTFVPDSSNDNSHNPINSLGVLDALRNAFSFSKNVVVEADNQNDILIASPGGHDIKVALNLSLEKIDIVIKDEVSTTSSSDIFSVCNMIRYYSTGNIQTIGNIQKSTGIFEIFRCDTQHNPAEHNISAPIDLAAFLGLEHERYDITITFGNSQDSLWIRVITVGYDNNLHQYKFVISGQYMPGPAPSNNSQQA